MASSKTNHILILILCILGFTAKSSLWAQNEISNYKVVWGSITRNNQTNIVIRKYEKSKNLFYVTVNPNTIQTESINANNVNFKPSNWSQIQEDFKDTPYIKAIQTAQKESLSLQDSGITHGYPKEKGITLTIDLCPSHKPLDRIIFTSLIAEFKKSEKPIPIGLSITGRFLLTHSGDILWLQKLVKKGEITITWINHTYNHHYNPKIPLQENFLLEPNTDIDFEVLGTEIAMLQQGLVFSPFFRFPGLVSSQKLIDKITQYGLIPIGSDAWLAKGQQAHPGSIVLIHGNGNEPIGVKDFIDLIHNEKNAVLKKEWLLYDLRESLENEFESQ